MASSAPPSHLSSPVAYHFPPTPHTPTSLSLPPSQLRLPRHSACGSAPPLAFSFKPFLAGTPEGAQLKCSAAWRLPRITRVSVEATLNGRPLKVMISGAPAAGKGTQCELIIQKYGLPHISAGDLLRAEIAAGTENGKRAKEYMTKGQLVPNEIVVTMVKERLAQPDVQEKGWLLDGYPRSFSQAQALEDLGIKPDLFIVLDVPDNILVERVIGRRLDPVTGKIYHLKYSPPDNEEVAARLTQRFDDTEPKVKLRLQTHNENVDAVLSIHKNVLRKVDGSRPKALVFQDIDRLLTDLLLGEPQEIGV